MSYTIGIDLGTTNIKGCVLSDTGEVLFELSAPGNVNAVPTGGEIDPKQFASDFLDFLQKMITEAARVGDGELRAIGLTGMAEAGALFNLDGGPETPILLWYDQRGAGEAEELRPKYEELLTSVSGIRMSNVATIYKLCWLKKQMPLFSGLFYRWFGVPEFAAWVLTGKHYTDRSLAVRTAAYSLKEQSWSREVLNITGLDEMLFPEIIPALQQNICVSGYMAEKLGIPETVRVTVAGHDDIVAAYGAGLSAGVWVDSTGTAEGLIAPVSFLPDASRTVKERMSIAPWYTDGNYALVAGVGTSGSLLAALRDETGLSYEEIDYTALNETNVPENAITSELSPQRLAKISFAPDLTAEQMVSAVYIKILESFRARSEQIMKFTEAPEKLIILGGQSRLSVLSEKKAAILGGIPVDIRPVPEAAAYGAALIAL